MLFAFKFALKYVQCIMYLSYCVVEYLKSYDAGINKVLPVSGFVDPSTWHCGSGW